MADQLTSPGPDSSGVWWEKENHLAFGHRRLAIVDLTQNGHQPMTSASERFVITYNGEVYNAPELHETLSAKGYSFRGSSDTEVILAACETYGVEEATKLLIGMFALWDAKDRKLHLPTFLVSRLAQKHLKVCLSGDGGDEFFAGYSRYFQAERFWNRLSPLPKFLRKIASSGIRSISPAQWDFVNGLIPGKDSRPHMGDKAHKLASLLNCPNRKSLYLNLISLWDNPESLVLNDGKDSYEGLQDPWGKNLFGPDNSFIEEMQYIDSRTYLPDDILSKVDYASMAVGLESRVPLLDHRVVEFAWAVPLELKQKHPQGKWILREVLKRYVPESLTERPKMGFGVPIDQWLKGPLRSWTEELLSESSLKNSGLNSSPIHQRWQDHLSGKRHWHYALWPVLMYQAWHESVESSLSL